MGSSSGKGGTGAAKDTIKMNKQLFQESTPVRKELLGQTLEALTTGGVGARIPLIQRAVEANKAGLAQGLRASSENISSIPGLAGTPFAESIMAQQRVGGEQALAGIPTEIAGQIAGGASNLALGFPQIANQGMIGGANVQSNAKGQQLGLVASLFNSAANLGSAGLMGPIK